MSDKTAKNVQRAQNSIKSSIKTYMFDLIAVVIIIVLIAVSLGVIERKVITLSELSDICIECVPFFLVFVMLGNNYYMKGSYVGKSSNIFSTACENYSDIIDDMTDDRLDTLDDFCEEYNRNALKRIQENYLHRATVTYKKFTEPTIVNDKVIKPLTSWTNDELKKEYGDAYKWIIAAKNANVKGIKSSTLMGNEDNADPTDIGKTEAQLSKKRKLSSAVTYLASTVVMALIAIKNITEWHWFGFALVAFKCIYIFCRSYIEYFTGYNDVTIHLVNHINRKCDILKQHRNWYNINFKSNKIEKSE